MNCVQKGIIKFEGGMKSIIHYKVDCEKIEQ